MEHNPTHNNASTISVVVPMYNEEANILFSLQAIQRAVQRITSDYEIIIVNDASTDTSPACVAQMSETDTRIKLLHHTHNRTLGATLRTGFKAAQKDLVFYTDADLPFDMEEVARAVQTLHEHNADVVSVYRYSRRGEGVIRIIYSYVYNSIIKILFGLHFKDVNFSFKLFKRTLLSSFSLFAEGSFIDAEFLIKASRQGFKIIQFGTNYFPRQRGISRLCRFPIIVCILYEMMKCRLLLFFKPKTRPSE